MNQLKQVLRNLQLMLVLYQCQFAHLKAVGDIFWLTVMRNKNKFVTSSLSLNSRLENN